nr:hypothetical protein Ade03nite_82940 [Actinoplanes derwentensis]
MTRSSSPARHIREAVPFRARGGLYSSGSAMAAGDPPVFTAATIASSAEAKRPPRAVLGARVERTINSNSTDLPDLDLA